MNKKSPKQTVIPSGSEGSPTNVGYTSSRSLPRVLSRGLALSERSESNGFSLIETLVAVTLFALTATLLVAAITNILRLSSRFTLQRQINHETSNALETISLNTRAALGGGGEGAVYVVPTDPNDPDYRPEAPNKGQLQLRLNDTLGKAYIGEGQLVAQSDIYYDEQKSPALLDVMLVLDVSGSMGYPISDTDPTLKINALKNAAINFVMMMKIKYDNNSQDLRIGIVTFETRATMPVSLSNDWLQTGPGQVIDTIWTAIPTPGDITNMEGGIILAGDALKEDPVPGAKRVIILMSDGVANTSNECIDFQTPEWCLPIYERAKALAKDQADYYGNKKKYYSNMNGVIFYTIGLGSPGKTFDEVTLKYIAEDKDDPNLVRYANANDAVGLREAFADIPDETTVYNYNSTDYSSLTSDQVVVKDLLFEAGGMASQPYVDMTMTVGSSTSDVPAWLQSSTTFQTVISSRHYEGAL